MPHHPSSRAAPPVFPGGVVPAARSVLLFDTSARVQPCQHVQTVEANPDQAATRASQTNAHQETPSIAAALLLISPCTPAHPDQTAYVLRASLLLRLSPARSYAPSVRTSACSAFLLHHKARPLPPSS